jgi:hypothetical protein
MQQEFEFIPMTERQLDFFNSSIANPPKPNMRLTSLMQMPNELWQQRLAEDRKENERNYRR